MTSWFMPLSLGQENQYLTCVTDAEFCAFFLTYKAKINQIFS